MKRNLPQIVAPPYHTKLGRSEVGRAVQQVYKDEAQRERDRLVMEHLPLAKEIALKVHEKLPIHVDLDDIVHAAVLGLFDAISKYYDPKKKVAFVSYARHRIKGAILDSLRQLDWASRDLRRRQKQISAAMAELGPDATEAQIAEGMGVSLERWRQMIAELKRVGLQLPAGLPERGGLSTVFERALAHLPPRDLKVVTLYYSRDMTMREIADELGVNESRVSNLRSSAIARLASALTAELGSPAGS